MIDYRLIPTSADVWAVIHARHRADLSVYSSFSNPDGREFGGDGTRGEMITEYGLRGSDFPLMKARSTWDIDQEKSYKRINEQHEYWLCVPLEDKE